MKLLSKVMLGAMFALVISSCKKEAQISSSENSESNDLEMKSSQAINSEFNDVHLCTEMYVGNTPERAAAIKSKKWKNGSEITVRMYGGTSYIRGKVMKYANEWSKYANITFKFVTSGAANLRITFTSGAGSYSYIGTDALRIPSNSETMNYGWLTSRTPEQEFSRVIIHEFGHALGLIHEQQHPLADIPWDKDKVYAYYSKTQGWTQDEVDNNLFNLVDESLTQYSAYDPNSIMHYSVPKELTDGEFEVGLNNDLSSTDKSFIAAAYPKP